MAENRLSNGRGLPKYVSTFRRRPTAAQAARGVARGVRRWAFRRNGHTIQLPSPLDPSFEVRYCEAMLATQERRDPTAKRKGGAYSVEWLLDLYRESSGGFGDLAPSTLKAKLNLMDRIVNDWGEVDIRKITVPGLAAELGRVKSPAVRNRVRGIFRQIFAFAVVRGYMSRNIADDVPRAAIRSVATHGWTPAERAQYCEHWPTGSRERLAFTLLFETVQRSSDVVLMGAGNIAPAVDASGEAYFVIEGFQVKTGSPYRVPVSESLAAELEAVADLEPFIQTAYGIGFSAKGFQTWFGEKCKAAGLPDKCRGHGLRSAGCHEIAEAGASAIELMAISGHKTLAEAQKYIAGANKNTLAESAGRKRRGSRAASDKFKRLKSEKVT